MDKVEGVEQAGAQDQQLVVKGDDLGGDRLKVIVEGLLFASGEPLSLPRLLEIIGKGGFKADKRQVRKSVESLQRDYEASGRGIRLVEVAGGFQLRTSSELAEWVKLLFAARPWRLTRATLETLAIIAYRQPVTRAEIEEIRGVDVDGVLGSLVGRKLVRVVGRKEAAGRPLIYGTTQRFLEVFGLSDLESLPALAEVEGPDPSDARLKELPRSEEKQEEANAGQAPEDPESSGVMLSAQGGGPDQAGQGDGKRSGNDGAGEQS